MSPFARPSCKFLFFLVGIASTVGGAIVPPSESSSPSPYPKPPSISPRQGMTACETAFASCNMRFDTFRHALPTFNISGTQDTAFTSKLVWKDLTLRVGIANTALQGNFIANDGTVTPWNKSDTASMQSFSPSQFKPYPIVNVSFSGIGHETFQGNSEYATGKCVQVRISSYEVLGNSTERNVIDHVNEADECAVFKTI